MSVALKWTRACERCNAIMQPGTQVDFFKVGDEYRYTHVDCQEAAAEVKARPPKKKAEQIYDLRQCSSTPCSNAVGTAYPKGGAPSACERCGSAWEWTGDKGWLEDLAAAA